MGASSGSAGQSRALLASLLLRANSVVGRDVLIEELLDAARRARAAGDATRAVERVDAALALWRGPALSGLELVGALAAEAAPVQALTRTASIRRRPGDRDPLSHHRTHISLGTSAPHIRPKDQSQCQQSDQTRL